MRTFVIGDIHGAYKALLQCFNRTLEPVHVCNDWDLDTGAGWAGKLTIMDVETKEYWQSDLTPVVYGGTPGRS